MWRGHHLLHSKWIGVYWCEKLPIYSIYKSVYWAYRYTGRPYEPRVYNTCLYRVLCNLYVVTYRAWESSSANYSLLYIIHTLIFTYIYIYTTALLWWWCDTQYVRRTSYIVCRLMTYDVGMSYIVRIYTRCIWLCWYGKVVICILVFYFGTCYHIDRGTVNSVQQDM